MPSELSSQDIEIPNEPNNVARPRMDTTATPSTSSSSTVPPSTTTTTTPTPTYYDTGHHSTASWSYTLIRWLFRFVMNVFYANIVVEGAHEFLIPDGTPCVLTANHSNSLTDALLLVTTVPSWKRKLIRLTAKDTQFGRGTFTSFLIESAGTLPIKRPKDHLGQKVDNSVVFAKLISALGRGDMVAMFPEGMSRYYPQIAPLRQGVARIVSDTLAQQHDNPAFQVAIQPVSITYLHRNLFRSDVLVTFNPAILVSAATHPGLASAPASEPAIRSLTTTIARDIKAGILDAPSWAVLRAAHTARRLYAPLGTKLALGEHVRLTQRFVEGLSDEGRRAEKEWTEGESVRGVLKTPMVLVEEKKAVDGGDYFGGGGGAGATASSSTGPGTGDGSKLNDEAPRVESNLDVPALFRDLKVYQDLLTLYGIKDDRVRNPRMLRRRTLLKRILVRFGGAAFLLAISLPGLLFWGPVFIVATRQSAKNARKGPAWDTYDEVAQTKLVYGLITGVTMWILISLCTGPAFPITFLVLPVLLWMTLRWLEDLTSSVRALIALSRLLLLGKTQLTLLRTMRTDLKGRVERLASERCGLPRDGERWLVEEQRKERERKRWATRLAGGVRARAAFFDPRRRRKKDWNESLRLWDQTEYPIDEELPSGGVLPAASAAGGVPKDKQA